MAAFQENAETGSDNTVPVPDDQEVAEYLNQEGGKETEMKSILVMDTPQSCQECTLLDEDNWYCIGYHEACDLKGISNRPSWCPLKPMPQLMHYEQTDTQTVKAIKIDNGFRAGWNACLEEIEK